MEVTIYIQPFVYQKVCHKWTNILLSYDRHVDNLNSIALDKWFLVYTCWRKIWVPILLWDCIIWINLLPRFIGFHTPLNPYQIYIWSVQWSNKIAALLFYPGIGSGDNFQDVKVELFMLFVVSLSHFPKIGVNDHTQLLCIKSAKTLFILKLFIFLYILQY